jgi:hypothetical protein
MCRGRTNRTSDHAACRSHRGGHLPGEPIMALPVMPARPLGIGPDGGFDAAGGVVCVLSEMKARWAYGPPRGVQDLHCKAAPGEKAGPLAS